jgi:phosphonoacetaldehyde hydrolase
VGSTNGTNGKRTLKAVVLDWAGTTVDYGCMAPVAAFQAALKGRDIQVHSKQVREFMGRSKRDHIRSILELDDVKRQWVKLHGADPGPEDVESLYQDFVAVQDAFIRESARLIPGCAAAIANCRSRGLKIGSSTGYFREQMDILAPIAAQNGYAPDTMICANDIPAGRPEPFEIYENAKQLNVESMRDIVKVDDTVVGIQAGINAGSWTVGVCDSGNLVGMGEEELNSLSESDRRKLVDDAASALRKAGAHVVISTIADLPGAIDQLEQQIACGAQP